MPRKSEKKDTSENREHFAKIRTCSAVNKGKKEEAKDNGHPLHAETTLKTQKKRKEELQRITFKLRGH